MELTRRFNWQKWILNTFFILGIIYGFIAFRYFLYIIYPSNIWFINDYHIGFYLNPLSNKIAFLMHAGGGALAFWLAYFVFNAYKKNWNSFKTITRWYLFGSFLVVFPFPVMILLQSRGFSNALFLLTIIEFLNVYLLARAYYFFRKKNYPQFIIYFIYLFSFQVCTGLNRPFQVIFTHTVFPQSQRVMDLEQLLGHFNFDPTNLALDFGTLLYLVMAISLAKFLMYIQVINKY